jgi:hypothetical protein
VPDDTPRKQQHQKGLITRRVPSSNPKKERKKEKARENMLRVSNLFTKEECAGRERERERKEKALKSSLNL